MPDPRDRLLESFRDCVLHSAVRGAPCPYPARKTSVGQHIEHQGCHENGAQYRLNREHNRQRDGEDNDIISNTIDDDCDGLTDECDHCSVLRYDGGLDTGTTTFDGKEFVPLVPTATAGVPMDSIEGLTGDYPIDNTDYPELYQKETWIQTSPVTFTFSVVPEDYVVHLHFVDWHLTDVDDRIFTVQLQGNDVLTDFDIIGEVGTNYALIKSYDVSAPTGEITLTIINQVFYAEIAGVEILPAHILPLPVHNP